MGISPLAYRATSIRLNRRGHKTGEFGLAAVMVEASVSTASQTLEHFFYHLISQDSLDWSFVVHAFSEIVTVIGVTIWQGLQRTWSWKDFGLWNAFFDHRGFCLLDFEHVLEGREPNRKVTDGIGKIINQMVGIVQSMARQCDKKIPDAIWWGLEKFVGQWKFASFERSYDQVEPLVYFGRVRGLLLDSVSYTQLTLPTTPYV